jgi:hypothetical protein
MGRPRAGPFFRGHLRFLAVLIGMRFCKRHRAKWFLFSTLARLVAFAVAAGMAEDAGSKLVYSI